MPSNPIPEPSNSTTRPRATEERHEELLQRPSPDSDRTLDAIVVSASRPAHNLRHALELAVGMDTAIVILCSGAASPADVNRLASGTRHLRGAVVTVRHGYRGGLTGLRTDAMAAHAGGLGDLSIKRNLGLLISRLAGWHTIMFLDDDIRGLDPTLIGHAVAAVVEGGAAGMPAREFPDNSIVCHANRVTGYEQDVFVSGSALVVDCTEITSFFPRIYNEDWMFMAPAVQRGAVTEVGSSRQLAYEPFAVPQRAADQEFGNVVADGLMSLLHHADLEIAARPEYWKGFLLRRKDFIAGIAARTRPADGAVLAALAAAERRRASMSAQVLARYVADWQRDRAVWTDGVAALPGGMSLLDALRILGLADDAIIVTAPDGTFAPSPSGWWHPA